MNFFKKLGSSGRSARTAKQAVNDPFRTEKCAKLQEPESSPQTVLEFSHLEDKPVTVLHTVLPHPSTGYRCVQYLSRGASGLVLLAEDKYKGKKRALKLIDIVATKNKYAEREIINHFKLKHPHVISLEEMFMTDQHLVLVMEYADKGDLFSYIKSKEGLREEETRWFFQQLILAIDFCHRMGVVNRDIKPENILLSSSKDGKTILKLCDFGFSKDTVDHSAPKTRLGTAMYTAPEVIQNMADGEYDGCQSDVWSCGVMLYVMLTCRYPFLPEYDIDCSHKRIPSIGIKQIHSLFANTLSNKFESIPEVSQECNALLARMLEPDPHKRATVSDIMSSAWFNAGLGKELSSFNNRVIKKLQDSPSAALGTTTKVQELLKESKSQHSCSSKVSVVCR